MLRLIYMIGRALLVVLLFVPFAYSFGFKQTCKEACDFVLRAQ